jgi:AcrR family transcriptional regulator
MSGIEQPGTIHPAREGAMPEKSVDRRVQRTRENLRAALMALIEERGFEALSVQEIIDRANVGRATFYAHYESKEDLLVSGLDDFRAAIREHQRRRRDQAGKGDDGAFLFSRELFDHVAAHRNVFRAMVGKRSGAVVQRLFQKILLDLVREDLRAVGSSAELRSATAEASAQYVAGGLWGLVSWWVDAKKGPGVEEMDAIFRRLAMPTLRSVRP